MGVYIPGIMIPEKCSKCRDTGLKFTIDKLGLKCPERKEIYGPTEADIKGIRRPDCPLVHVQEPHGRLIEAERLKEVFHRNVVSGDAFDQLIDIAPTIIPSDKGG